MAPDGLALLCAGDGAVLECLRDDLDTISQDVVGHPFSILLDRTSLGRAATMFSEVRARAASFNQELLVRTRDDRIEALFFMAGLLDDGRTLLIGTGSRGALADLYDDLMTTHGERIRLVRSLLRERSNAGPSVEEFTRMNNELTNAQRELSRTNANLARAVAEKNRLIGMASHDLRDPLGAIRSMADLLAQDELDIPPERERELVRRIHRSSDYMLSVIDQMLQWTTLEAGHLDLKKEPLELRRLVDDVVAVQGIRAEGKGIEVQVDVPSDLPPVSLDGHRFEQVLNNLVGNAIKFSPSGTTVRIEAGLSDGGTTLSVRDEGPGIPAGEIADLFRPFSRTSVRASRGEPSTGLGLAIAAKIVEAHGGTVRCESTVGDGTTFVVTVPEPGRA